LSALLPQYVWAFFFAISGAVSALIKVEQTTRRNGALFVLGRTLPALALTIPLSNFVAHYVASTMADIVSTCAFAISFWPDEILNFCRKKLLMKIGGTNDHH